MIAQNRPKEWSRRVSAAKYRRGTCPHTRTSSDHEEYGQDIRHRVSHGKAADLCVELSLISENVVAEWNSVRQSRSVPVWN